MFFKSFKKEKKTLINETSNTGISSKKDFANSINIKDNKEYFDLQLKLENGTLSVDDLSIFDVIDLIDLYNRQSNLA